MLTHSGFNLAEEKIISIIPHKLFGKKLNLIHIEITAALTRLPLNGLSILFLRLEYSKVLQSLHGENDRENVGTEHAKALVYSSKMWTYLRHHFQWIMDDNFWQRKIINNLVPYYVVNALQLRVLDGKD